MSPSVSAMPRARSVSSDERSSPPRGASISASHSASSRRPARTAERVCSGSVTVGKRWRATGAMRAESSANRCASRGSPVVSRNEAAVARGIPRVDEDSALGVRRVGRVRGVAPAAEVDAQAEIVDDALGQQAHEVRVARQPGVDPRPRQLRHRGAADVGEPLEHDDRASCAGEVGRGDEGVVASADDHDIMSGGDRRQHASTLMRPPLDRVKPRDSAAIAWSHVLTRAARSPRDRHRP